MEKMNRLREIIKMLIEDGFSGYIKINFSQGSLGRVEKSEQLDEAALLPAEKNGKNAGKKLDIQRELTREM